MAVVLITGASGLIGSEATRFFASQGFDVVGVDNDMRRYFFGDEGSTTWRRRMLEESVRGYRHVDADIRDDRAMDRLFASHGDAINLVIHTAAQPSHDWAAREPITDFTVNANGTLILLEMIRRHCPEAPFIFTSTNKVYGDTPNQLPLVELDTRWSVDEAHPFSRHGIDESMSIDSSMHSVFGASKVAADVMVQEYGRYFGLKTACFRGGCLTGPGHSGAELHGFLSYLVKCAVTGRPYTVFGYKGKQVRDNIHSHDLVQAFWHFFRAPQSRRGLQHWRWTPVELLDARSHCDRRAPDRPAAVLDLQRHQPRRRSHLVGERHSQVCRALSRLVLVLLARQDNRRDSRRHD